MILLSPGSKIDVEILSLDEKGNGLANWSNHENQTATVRVRGAFPGDRARIIIEEVSSKHKTMTARALEILTTGPNRIERVCAHASPCPACPFHGLINSLAVETKQKRIQDALAFQGITHPIEPFDGSTDHYGYRQKIKLVIGGIPGALTAGLYVPGSHRLVPADKCPYAMPQINEALAVIMAQLNTMRIQQDNPSVKGLKAIILRAGSEGIAAVLLTREPLKDKQFDALAELVTNRTLVSISERYDESASNSLLGGEKIKHYGAPKIHALDTNLRVDPDAFCQADAKRAQSVYSQVAEYVTQDDSSGWFLDAYAGTGGFSQALQLKGVSQIISVEQDPLCISPLRQLGVTAFTEPMAQALEHLGSKAPFKAIIADPPKKGLGALVEKMAHLGAERFVLVSCDPKSMAKDTAEFLRHGYQIDKIQPVDLFAGTPEIETVVFLRKI